MTRAVWSASAAQGRGDSDSDGDGDTGRASKHETVSFATVTEFIFRSIRVLAIRRVGVSACATSTSSMSGNEETRRRKAGENHAERSVGRESETRGREVPSQSKSEGLVESASESTIQQFTPRGECLDLSARVPDSGRICSCQATCLEPREVQREGHPFTSSSLRPPRCLLAAP